ncbi:hypothetical protein LH51_12050 [Nitrincola sp. A-D6]|uniref:FecR domain-containing protein n=1 Tax=Nitrincola sp. A-D6 TaxID=1545442 RepID=UPI00051FAF72|nr:FecR domain-containing protein [Nitrincola sp. A-D6]KGK40893.1 hypothetical protein LH51_18660 [Nitrincola sp. A-D6]KGK41820.1 hypothetical protein LH51_12050 [Nitrincola sp. A-D6]
MLNKPSADVIEAAATWYIDLREVSADDPLHQAHQHWLAADPSHRLAWKRVEKLQQACAQANDSISSSTLTNARASRRQMIKMLSVMLVAGASGGLAWQYRESAYPLMAEYRTGKGKSLQVTLADGSQLQLNTDSAVDIAFDAAQRQVILHQGEILVTTETDPQQRPFSVQTRQGNIRALGTQFLVLSDSHLTQVKVLQDAVEIRPAKGSEQPVRLNAGQQLQFTDHAVQPAHTIAGQPQAWIQGLLVVSDWRLDQFIEELSRYHPGKLSCDHTAASLRISGSFHLKDTQLILQNLTSTLPVRIRYFTRYWARIEAI